MWNLASLGLVFDCGDHQAEMCTEDGIRVMVYDRPLDMLQKLVGELPPIFYMAKDKDKAIVGCILNGLIPEFCLIPRKLGQGTYGTVWTCFYKGMICAAKVIPVDESNPTCDEYEITSRLDNPYIMPIKEYACGKRFPPGKRYHVLVMPKGTPLNHSAAFSTHNDRVACAEKIRCALDYLHSRGIVHLDVKPHNVLRGDENGEVWLSDLGLARPAAKYKGDPAVCALWFSSPEVLLLKKNKLGDKERSWLNPYNIDKYALMITQFCIIAGHAPFEAKSLNKQLKLIHKNLSRYELIAHVFRTVGLGELDDAMIPTPRIITVLGENI